MPNPDTDLSRRERQIMDVLYAQGEATVLQIRDAIPDAPTPMAVRRMLHILEEKGHLKRRKQGREVIYAPKTERKRAGTSALQHVLETFFEGSLEQALAAHLISEDTGLSDDDHKRLVDLIEQARRQGN